MATSTSGSSAKKSAAKKATTVKKPTTTVKTVSATEVRAKSAKTISALPTNIPGIILAEIIGTFSLTMVALLTLQQVAPLYVGLTVAALVIALGAISGTHINPAVTFGLWSIRRLKTALVPIYWVAQFVGAIIAVLLLNVVSNGTFTLSFANFTSLNWNILTVEAIGTTIFLFGLVAVVSHKELSTLGKGLGIGLSLMIGLLVSNTVTTTLQSGVDTSNVSIDDPSSIPREYSVKGATLNPAVALAVTENTVDQLSGGYAGADETRYSNLTLEVIFGTLIGAALGSNLYLLVAGAGRKDEK